MPRTRVTVLSDMAGHEWSGASGHDPAVMLAQVRRWGLDTIDLKTVLGKNIAELTDAETAQVAAALRLHKVEVQAFSTGLLRLPVENGATPFRQHLEILDRVLAIARQLQPRMIRLIAAETTRRRQLGDSWSYLQQQHPWVVPIYHEAVTHIHAAGFQAVIENEGGQCIFSRPAEIVNFFTALGRLTQARFTWDVQNLWQLGTLPSLEVYRRLQPFIGYYHLKGGRAAEGNPELVWRAPLEGASWPVLEITRAVIADGVSPVICLNPSHGKIPPGESAGSHTENDLSFLRRNFPEIA